jgi:uncharacterized membrane protein YjgN (DUF898 family)
MSEDTSYPNASRTPTLLSAEALRLDFVGKPLDYFFILLKTLFFTLATFGLFFPWARAQRLRYVYNHTKIGTHSLSFHGQGLEIAIGFLKALIVYAIFSYGTVLLQAYSQQHPIQGAVFMMILLLLFYSMIPFALWAAQAYRVSRLRYRSIYFSQDPRERKLFVVQIIFDMILTLLTFGLYAPVMMYHIHQGLIQGLRWGNLRFHSTAQLSTSYTMALFHFFACVLTLGLYIPFAMARRLNFYVSHLQLGNLRFELKLGAMDALKVFAWPVLATTFTLGLAFPWVDAYRRRHLYQAVRVLGELDLTQVEQRKESADAKGEGFADVWGLDAGLGV